MSDLDIAVKAKFVNQMGSGSRSAERDLKGVRDMAQRLGAADFGNRMRNQFRTAAEGAAALHTKLQSVGNFLISFKAGYETIKRTLGEPVMADANFGDIVIDIGQKANLSRGEVAGLSDEIKGMAERLKSSPEAIGKGLDVLMSSLPDIDVSKKLIAPIVKVSKAYRVETDSISQAVFSMVNNLGVAPDKVEIALGRIAQAAADGRYEIKNFAEGMPGLAATMQGLGQTGLSGVSRLSAALETVSGSVGNAADATTSVDDLLQKVVSPDVVKNFKDAGVNIQGRIDKAKKEGTDVFEAIYKATTKATGGDTSKVVNFFGDKEARRGIVSLMQNWEKYKEMRDRYEAINSPDKLNSDFAMRQDGSGNSLRTFGERWEAMQTAVGQGVNTYLKPALDVLSGILDVFTRLAEQIPAATGALAIFATTAGAIAVSASVGAFLKRFGGMATPAVPEAAAPASKIGGIWKWLGMGAGFAGKALRFGGSAYLGYELGRYAGKGALELGSVVGGKYYTPADIGERDQLRQQRADIASQIAKIRKESKVPEMADILIRPLQDQLDQLDARLKSFDELTVKPNIDSSSVDAALGKVSALSGALRGLSSPSFTGNAVGPSFRNNAESASVSRAAAAAGGGQGATNHNTYNVAGYSPSVVARRIQRDQDRQLAKAQSGALHDTLSFA